jgi:hypothetical protein
VTFKDKDFENDLVFDPDDVDLADLVPLSIGIHGQMCPEIHDLDHAEAQALNMTERVRHVSGHGVNE